MTSTDSGSRGSLMQAAVTSAMLLCLAIVTGGLVHVLVASRATNRLVIERTEANRRDILSNRAILIRIDSMLSEVIKPGRAGK